MADAAPEDEAAASSEERDRHGSGRRRRRSSGGGGGGSGGGGGERERRTGPWLTVGVIAVVVAAPLAIGGAIPAVQVALSAACLVLFVAFLLRPEGRELKLAPLTPVLLLAALWTTLQLLPLPRGLVGWLSPETLRARMDAAGGVAPALLPLTLDVPATMLEALKAFSLAGLFVVVSGIAHRRRRAVPILVAVATVGGLIALVGIAQRATGAERILWLYKPDWWKGFVGTFVNNNHAAEFYGLSLCVSLGLAAEPNRWRGLGIASAIACTIGLGLTMSRAGIVAFGLAGLVLATLLLARRFGAIKGVLLGTVAVACAGAAILLLFDGVSERFAQVDWAYLQNNQKVRGWRDAVAMIADHRWTGVGRGAFAAPFQRYRSVEDGTVLNYPENQLQQLAAEWGVPATVALVALAGAGLWRHRRRVGALGVTEWATAVGIGGVLLQNQADFGLEMPGVALPTVALLGVVVGRACAKESVQRWRIQRPVAAVAAVAWVVALGLGVWALPRTLRADDQRLMAMLTRGASPAEIDVAAQAAIERHPCDYHLELLDALAHVRAGDGTALRHLNRVLRLRPREVEAHRLAAVTLARARRPAQAALEYRTAFENGAPLTDVLLDELATLPAAAAVDAVPQNPVALMALAARVSPRHPALAEAACARGVALAPSDERIPLLALRLATVAGDRARMARASAMLEKMATSPEVVLAAATGYRAAGQRVDAGRVLRAGTVSFPQDATANIAWVQYQLEGNDLDGARRSLDRLERATTSLDTRRQAEELRAVVEQRAGDEAAAVSARTRARLYSRALGGGDKAMP